MSTVSGVLPHPQARHRAISETDWRRWWDATAPPTLPPWVRPLRQVGISNGAPERDLPDAPFAGSVDDGDGMSGVDGVDGPGGDTAADGLTADLLTTAARATTLVEARSSFGRRGALAVFAVAGGDVAGFMRQLVSPDGRNGLCPLAGLRLIEVGIDALLESVMRLVPPDQESLGRETVLLPADRAFALADAARADAAGLCDDIAEQFGDGQPLGVLRAMARELCGTLDIRVSSARARGSAFSSWVLTDEGWVALRARGTSVLHVPVGRAAIRARVLAGLTSSLAAGRVASADLPGGDDGA